MFIADGEMKKDVSAKGQSVLTMAMMHVSEEEGCEDGMLQCTAVDRSKELNYSSSILHGKPINWLFTIVLWLA